MHRLCSSGNVLWSGLGSSSCELWRFSSCYRRGGVCTWWIWDISCDPIGYLDFLKFNFCAKVVLTDSGGIQEETTVFKIPCMTLRENTERPVTTEIGSNQVVGTNPEKILSAYHNATSGKWKEPQIPPLWHGRAAERIEEILLKVLQCLKLVSTSGCWELRYFLLRLFLSL